MPRRRVQSLCRNRLRRSRVIFLHACRLAPFSFRFLKCISKSHPSRRSFPPSTKMSGGFVQCPRDVLVRLGVTGDDIEQ